MPQPYDHVRTDHHLHDHHDPRPSRGGYLEPEEKAMTLLGIILIVSAIPAIILEIIIVLTFIRILIDPDTYEQH